MLMSAAASLLGLKFNWVDTRWHIEQHRDTEYLEQNTTPRIVGLNPTGVVDVCLL